MECLEPKKLGKHFHIFQVFRAWKGSREEMRNLRNPKFSLSQDEKCCAERAKVDIILFICNFTVSL